MICDYHLHTEFSIDSQVPVRDQIEQAIRLGMDELCITDHHDYDSAFCGLDFSLDLPAYLEELRELKEIYRGQIRLKIGVELGLQNRIRPYLESFMKEYGEAFDFIIGSSHFVDRVDPYDGAYWQDKTFEQAMGRYFEVTLDRVRLLHPCFDVLGHLDYVIRYAPVPDRAYDYEPFAPVIDDILKCLIEKGKGLECNSGGLAYGLSEPNPCRKILARYRQLGGEIITIGSDAHRADRLGYGFDRCRELLLDCGFTRYTVFNERKPVFLPL